MSTMLFNIIKGLVFVVGIVWVSSFIKKSVGIEKFNANSAVNTFGSIRGFQNFIFTSPFHRPNTLNYYYTDSGHLFPFEMQEITLGRNDMTALSDLEMDRYFVCNRIITPRNSPGMCG